jgi:exodeoxyribonuclease VII large subunit
VSRPRNGPSRPTAYGVSEALAVLRDAVDGAMGQVWIKGEVAEQRRHRNGAWYFTLRDAEAQIRCVMWPTYAVRLKMPPADGTEVYILARPSIWMQRGELRFSAVTVLPTAGVGLQQLAFLQVKDALARDGLLDPARKRPLPPFPEAVAVVTSLDGAALHDMVTVARRRWPAVRVYVVGSAVQGEQAETELARALGVVNRLPVQVCVLGRGGGSREDLAAFDTEAVCRAIAAVTVPVVSAVGHETDVSLADLVADVRAATPSAAMELVLPDRGDILGRVGTLAAGLAQGLRRRTALVQARLHRSGDRLRHAMAWAMRREQERVVRLGAQLDALSPLRALERGYAVPRGRDGRVLRRRGDFPPGLPFRLRVSDGEVDARAEAAS